MTSVRCASTVAVNQLIEDVLGKLRTLESAVAHLSACQSTQLVTAPAPTSDPNIEVQYTGTWRGPDDRVHPNNRVLFVCDPPDSLKKPPGGWPCLIYFQFMDRLGYLQAVKPQMRGGIRSVPLPAPSADPTYANIMEIMQLVLASGVKIICLGQYSDDNMFFSDCNPPTLNTDPSEGCYNGGDNPDFAILRWLFGKMKKPDPAFGALSDIDFDNIGLWGYSVGATMVSRCIQAFPSLNDSATVALLPPVFPTIKYGVMVSGGSYACYGYRYWDYPPENFRPCKNTGVGCCPHNFTEMYYGSIDYKYQGADYEAVGALALAKNHPPILLLQSEEDNYADPNASKYYFEVLNTLSSQQSSSPAPVWKNMFPETKDSSGNWQYSVPHPGNLHGVYDRPGARPRCGSLHTSRRLCDILANYG